MGVPPVKVTRKALGDGQPPAYVLTSPCCDVEVVLPAWVVEHARAYTGGRLLIECGRYTADPLRAVRAVGTGCGSRYVVVITAEIDQGERGTAPRDPHARRARLSPGESGAEPTVDRVSHRLHPPP